ncbi:NAD(P)/FAD-dependent oxidoreductase [Bacillus sp. AFS041924]|uniref:NAD(P)/FAD-dependent oxidoreductase n=1 Tax=Bacillus sp. AFS041924 TaxID=2033503 RepID=UPI000BFDC740|nr:NAD(P)/FAD-dependent oxidoreductase [Bacillus sp. AFS041924]PGS49560.1 pyridine nucleotide-disulfide oxidoreductase [Bacillus sp. AFS041924]
MNELYECIIIGGGFAGLQASIQLGRYQRKVLVIDSNYGRSTICKTYRNILGWPDSISGQKLRQLGRNHAEVYGVSFIDDKVISIQKVNNYYKISTKEKKSYTAKTILLATGLIDRIPQIKNLVDCLGSTIFVCPDCDGYEILNKSVLILGAGDVGANLAITLTYWSNQITYINHDGTDINSELFEQLQKNGIQYRKELINEVIKDDESTFKGVRLQSGEIIFGERAFIGFSGNEVQNNLAIQLGVNLLNNKHVLVDSRTKETNVENVWAAGDLVAHSQQVTIAMGDGTQAAVWIQKRLLEMNSNQSL